jgi:hypothetical protein
MAVRNPRNMGKRKKEKKCAQKPKDQVTWQKQGLLWSEGFNLHPERSESIVINPRQFIIFDLRACEVLNACLFNPKHTVVDTK